MWHLRRHTKRVNAKYRHDFNYKIYIVTKYRILIYPTHLSNSKLAITHCYSYAILYISIVCCVIFNSVWLRWHCTFLTGTASNTPDPTRPPFLEKKIFSQTRNRVCLMHSGGLYRELFRFPRFNFFLFDVKVGIFSNKINSVQCYFGMSSWAVLEKSSNGSNSV